ncbi:hypothetical protein NDU88_003200 [Pleurodeles waltl]|uniref:Uncharacterized protein n=1 Tax=Pleurodeles waltl TaxID=8319 RepID=A0AAV7UZX1_PLEWA|nr:hypothetical protein NDU88_003200 [Pleurodeles waltl]
MLRCSSSHDYWFQINRGQGQPSCIAPTEERVAVCGRIVVKINISATAPDIVEAVLSETYVGPGSASRKRRQRTPLE